MRKERPTSAPNMVIRDQENSGHGKIVGMRYFARKTYVQFEFVNISENNTPGQSKWYDQEDLNKADLENYCVECNIKEASARTDFLMINVTGYNLMGTNYYIATIPNTGNDIKQHKICITPEDGRPRYIHLVHGPKAKLFNHGIDNLSNNTVMVEFRPTRDRYRITRSN